MDMHYCAPYELLLNTLGLRRKKVKSAEENLNHAVW